MTTASSDDSALRGDETREELVDLAQRMFSFVTLSEKLALADREEPLFELATSSAVDVVGAQRASIALLEPEGASFRVLSRDGRRGVYDLGESFPLEGTAVAEAVSQQRAIHTAEYPLDRFPDWLQLAEIGLDGFINAPLQVAGEIIGTLNIGMSSPRSVEPVDVRLAQQLASVLAANLQLRRLTSRLENTLEEQRRRERQQLLLATAVESAGDIIEITTPDAVLRYVNPAFERILGFSAREALGKTPGQLLRSEVHDPQFFATIDQTLAAGRSWRGLLISRAQQGHHVYLEATIAPVVDSEGEVTHHVAVKRDITARLEAEAEMRRINAELERARDAALAANRAKSQFLANMSHEVRTPLNAIIGYTEMLSEEADELGQQSFVRDLEHVRGAGAHLLSLLNGILDLSKIEAGAMGLHLERFVIADVIAEAANTVETLVEKQNNKLTIDVDDDLGTMHADLTKVRQMLINLMSNAAKFTHEGEVRLRAVRIRSSDAEDEQILLEISDTGIGMSEEQQQQLFQPFSQADSSTSREYGGTGLGLTISKRFCEMMGGKITMESALGEGTKVSVLLPARVGERSASGDSAPEASEQPGASAAASVLVIDDDAEFRELLVRSLSRRGFTVEGVADGEAGLARARDHRPGAIVLDVLMPGRDGWTILTELKQDVRTAQVPVVMLTAVDKPEVGFALGARDFLVKPVEINNLARLLRRHCGSGRARVLLVDDDPRAREMLRRGIQGAGHDVIEAANGRAALARLEQAPPDLVLLDLLMPEMDGFKVLEEIDTREELREIPVVVVTAKDLTEAEREQLSSARQILERGRMSRQQLIDVLIKQVEAALAD